MRTSAVAIVFFLIAAAPGEAADIRPQALETGRLLGGASSLAAIGFPSDVPRAQIAPSLIRYLHAVRQGEDPELDFKRERLVDTLLILARAEAAAATWKSGLSLKELTNNQNTEKRRAQDSLAAFGLELREQRNVYSVREDSGGNERKAREVITRAGVDVGAMMRRLNAGETVHIEIPAIEIPLPLPRQMWQMVLERSLGDSDWLPALLQDRHASLLTYGLLGTDSLTRGWIAATPGALKSAFEHAPAFALVAPALRFRQNAFELPGGAPAGAAWQALIEEKPSSPEKVFHTLVTKDDGQLAFFVQTVADLDAGHLRFVLGGTSVERDSLKRLYASFGDPKTQWKLDDRPFSRGRIDGASILRSLVISPDGVLAGPRWRRLWETAYSSDDVNIKSTGALKALSKSGMIDAPWFVEHILSLPPGVRDLRFRTLLLAQRVFPTPREVDTTDIVVALRGDQLFPSLTPTLERIGVRTPAVYAALTRAAARIAQAPEEVRPAALAQLQGGLVLVDRLRMRGVLSLPDAERAVGELGALAVDNDGWFAGGVAGWVQTMATRLAGANATGPAQSQIIDAAAGMRAGRSTREFVWESASYSISLSPTVAARMTATFEKGAAPSLDTVLRLVSESAQIRSAATPDALRRAAMVMQLPAKPDAAVLIDEREADVFHDAREHLEDLQRISKPKDLKKVVSMMVPLQRLIDLECAAWLRAFAYSAVSPADDTASTLDVARRHDFNLQTPNPAERPRAPWREPSPLADENGWRIQGSLLGLDVPLSKFVLRRLSDALPPHPPTLGATVRDELEHTVMLLDTRAATDQQVEAIAAATKRGRERFLAAVGSGDPAETLRVARTLSPWRREAIAWTSGHDPEHLLSQVTALDLMLLGWEASSTPPDSWGTSQATATGCLCLALNTTVPWESLAGRSGSGEADAAIADVALRLAEHLATLHVPVELLPAISALATQDVIDNATAVSDDDGHMAVARAAGAITRARVEDYVAAVIARAVAHDGATELK